MKILFCLNHPAHFHLCKNLMNNLKCHGHEVFIIARKKDVLLDLLRGYDYYLMPVKRGANLLQKMRLLSQTKKCFLDYVDKVKPDFVTGTGLFYKITSKKSIPTFQMAEDDIITNLPIFLIGLLFYNNYSGIFSPESCNNAFWNKKTIKYAGFQKLAYLHPNYFTASLDVINKYPFLKDRFFILRFAQLNAYHDIDSKGINTVIAQKIIDLLSPQGSVYISSERELKPQFEKYRLKIDPSDIHHVLAYATLMIGDSQSMAVEAAMLGTPSIRFNDFAGKIGILEELEHKYGLTFGVKTSNPDLLFARIGALLAMPNLKDIFQKRREKMLADKIDVTAFFTWFIENYPNSAEIMKKDSNYQYRFR